MTLPAVLAEFSYTWKLFIKTSLPDFLSDKVSDLEPINGHPALARVLLPLVGTLMGVFLYLPVLLLDKIFRSGLLPGITAAVFAPLLVEFMTSWRGLLSLAQYVERRKSGETQEDALALGEVNADAVLKVPSMILVLSIYLFRMLLFGVLAYFHAAFWFVIAFTGAYLVRAVLAGLNEPGNFGRSWFGAPRGMEQYHYYTAAGAFLVFGLFHPWVILLAFGISWTCGWFAKNLCLGSISGINIFALDMFGYAAEIVLLLTGVLFFAVP